MKMERQVLIEVNGKSIIATVTVDMPGIVPDDHISPDMLLSAVASGQNRNYLSRHNRNKVVKCTMNPSQEQLQQAYPPLRRVA